jgi:hypothetical protein
MLATVQIPCLSLQCLFKLISEVGAHFELAFDLVSAVNSPGLQICDYDLLLIHRGLLLELLLANLWICLEVEGKFIENV